MEGFNLTFFRAAKPAFDQTPAQARHRIFGVDYVHIKGLQSGDFYFTRFGWPIAESLLPDKWFTGEQFCKRGRALAGATGAVYRVPVPHPVRQGFSVVAKFSRFGQDVGVTLAGGEEDPELSERMASADFLPPFEEFGNLCALKRTIGRSLQTMVPLAIYSPPTRYLAWELGRKSHLQYIQDYDLKKGQSGEEEHRITYDWERIYILLYGWLDGFDAEQGYLTGAFSREKMEHLSRSTAAFLRSNGWIVLDHKPRHIILRKNESGLLTRHGKPVIGLIDYELLNRYHPAKA